MNTSRGVEHIMLIDDEDDCMFIVKLVLKRAGFAGKLTCFNSASDAYQHLTSTPREQHPDLIFIDINMPVMNGFDLVETCERECVISVDRTSLFMFSSSNLPEDQQRALGFRSVKDFVEKALNLESYRHIVRLHMAA